MCPSRSCYFPNALTKANISNPFPDDADSSGSISCTRWYHIPSPVHVTQWSILPSNTNLAYACEKHSIKKWIHLTYYINDARKAVATQYPQLRVPCLICNYMHEWALPLLHLERNLFPLSKVGLFSAELCDTGTSLLFFYARYYKHTSQRIPTSPNDLSLIPNSA